MDLVTWRYKRGESEGFAEWLKEHGFFKAFQSRKKAILSEHPEATKNQAYCTAALEFDWPLWKVENGEPFPDIPALPKKSSEPRKTGASRETFLGKDSSTRGDFQWVYENLAVDDVEPKDAPSSGAWGLYQFARSHPKEFYTAWMGMVSRQTDTDEVSRGHREDAARTTADIAEMLDRFRSDAVPQNSQGLRGEPAIPEPDAD